MAIFPWKLSNIHKRIVKTKHAILVAATVAGVEFCWRPPFTRCLGVCVVTSPCTGVEEMNHTD